MIEKNHTYLTAVNCVSSTWEIETWEQTKTFSGKKIQCDIKLFLSYNTNICMVI